MTSSAPRSTSNAVRSRTSAGHAATIAGAPIKLGFPSSRRTIRLRTPRLGSDASGHRSPTEDRQGYRRALAGPSAVGVCWAPIASGLGSVFVVIPTGSYANLVVSGLVDEAVLVCDASRPIALKPMSEWLRLTDPVVAVASDVLDQGVDPFERLAVLTLPPQIVLPGAFIPYDLHSARSRSTPSPSSSRLIES